MYFSFFSKYRFFAEISSKMCKKRISLVLLSQKDECTLVSDSGFEKKKKVGKILFSP
jgi:hypothetical protein